MNGCTDICVVTLILTHVTLTLCASIMKADIHVNVSLDTLVMALHALMSTNVPIPKIYQLTPLVQILMVALLSLAILVSKWLTTSDDFGFFQEMTLGDGPKNSQIRVNRLPKCQQLSSMNRLE